MQSDYAFQQFLLELDKQKNKILHARIIALNFNEFPIETIEGRVTQGSINIDGASAVRRTCSLTLIAQDFNYNNYLWGMNTKFKLEIGVVNNIDKTYPDIIWFKQGTYIITNFNAASSTNNFTISLQGKDKMCLLNGEVGGNFMATTYLDTIEEETKSGIWKKRKIPIKDIIRELVHVYGEEPYHNIIINDLDDLGLELLEYRYDRPMYLYREVGSNTYTNVTLDGNKDTNHGKLSELDASKLDILVDPLTGSQNPAEIVFDEDISETKTKYHIAKIEYGQTAGYRATDLVYPGDLIANIGESVTQPLDKIKNMLGEFEYFYDLDGRFVFQKKQAFKNTIWTPSANTQEEEEYIESLAAASNRSYTFSEGELITQFNNNPNLLNLRNDFSIWGERTSLGQKLPIHLRYAIDKKPMNYTTIYVEGKDVKEYNDKYGVSVPSQTIQKTYTLEDLGEDAWQEIIYQMAKDYNQYNFLDDFELRIIAANPDYPTGRTGYEQYYTDILGFWRDLYNPEAEKEESIKDQFYLDGEHQYWNKNVYEHPELLNFWFDFLDVEGELDQFSVKNVGARTKPVNDTNIKSIYFREVPNIIFDKNVSEKKNSSYKYIQANNSQMTSMFSISSQGLSAKDKLDELLYNHSYCCETATITAVPIYHLEPNTRIYLYDKKTNLHNDYIINKMTIPLTYNGMMTINATKAAETLLL